VNPNICREKWTPEEDSLLIKLVGELGAGKWASLARHLPGRTDQQCMGRWRRHLDPSIRKDAWSAEEDSLLQALHQKHGACWSLIAKALAHRTPQQCRGRWCILTGAGKSKQ
ncbi:Myb-like protein A, partial [Tetrabaena socialis]